MENFWKLSAAVLLASILGVVLDRQEKDISALLTIAVCAMIGAAGVSYLEPVLDLVQELKTVGNLQGDFLEILMKAVGIGLGAEVTGLICTDAGKASLGKALRMLGGAVILSLSVPLFRSLLRVVRQILGEL